MGALKSMSLRRIAPYVASSAAFWPLAWPLAQAHGWAFVAGLLYLTASWLFWHALTRWFLKAFWRANQAQGTNRRRSAIAQSAALFVAVVHALLSTYTLCDSLAYSVSGFHITPTLVSALWADAHATQTTLDVAFLPLIAAIGLYGLVAGIGIIAANKAATRAGAEFATAPTPSRRRMAAPLIGVTAMLTAQLVYSGGYMSGHTSMLQLRRISPYFISFEGWRLRALARTFRIESDNPFALAARLPAKLEDKDTNAATVTSPEISPEISSEISSGSLDAQSNSKSAAQPPSLPDVLIIVADSLRATAPTQAYDFAPLASQNGVNLDAQGKNFWDYRSDNYQSVANCTHFAVFSLLSGKLPTDFSSARKAQRLTPALRWFTEKGYILTSSEAASLDWYDTAQSLWGDSAVRRIAGLSSLAAAPEPSGPAQISADHFVVQDTLTTLLSQDSRSLSASDTPTQPAPKLHLAYFYGAHFPYGQTVTGALQNGPEQYAASIKRLDADISDMLAKLAARGGLDNTLVLLTADHGESFSGARPQGHAGDTQVDQRTVPLLVRLPNMWRTSHEHVTATLEAFRASDNQRLFIPALQAAIANAVSGDKAAIARFKSQASRTPQIYAGCSYDYPSSFTLTFEGKPYRFLHEDGFLYLDTTEATHQDKPRTSAALARLLQALNGM